jgi:hypothetical protein
MSARTGLHADSIGIARRRVLCAGITFGTGLTVTGITVIAGTGICTQSSLLAFGVRITRVAITRIGFRTEFAITTEAAFTRTSEGARTSLNAVSILITRRWGIETLIDFTTSTATASTVTGVTRTACTNVSTRTGLLALSVAIARIRSTVIDLNT